MRPLIIILLLIATSAAQAGDFKSRDGSTLGIYGTPASDEYEAFIDGTEFCTPTEGHTKSVIATLYCGEGNTTRGEDVVSAKGGVTFRGEFYATVRR